MIWGRFDCERSRLNIYDQPHFEPGSGISDIETVTQEIQKILTMMDGQPHALIKAKAVTFVLDHAAIEVNPADWFGFNFCGWLTRHQANSETAFRPLQCLILRPN